MPALAAIPLGAPALRAYSSPCLGPLRGPRPAVGPPLPGDQRRKRQQEAKEDRQIVEGLGLVGDEPIATHDAESDLLTGVASGKGQGREPNRGRRYPPGHRGRCRRRQLDQALIVPRLQGEGGCHQTEGDVTHDGVLVGDLGTDGFGLSDHEHACGGIHL